MSVAESTQIATTTESVRLPSYSVRVENYKPDNGTESLLMLGLSHKDRQSTHRRTEWMYKTNPAGPAVVCTIRHNKSEKDVGVLALCKRQIKTRSGIQNAGIFCDLVADRSHRTLGPALQLMQEALNTAIPLKLNKIYGWPNEKSIVLFKRFPSAELGQVAIYRRYFNWRSIFSNYMPRLPAAALGSMFNVADSTLQWVVNQLIRRLYDVSEIDSFDQTVDALWSTACERYEEIGVRDTEFLNWRFCQNSEIQHRILAVFSRKERNLVGYVVYRELNETSVEMSDFLAKDSRFSELALLQAFCHYVKKIGYEKVSVHFAGNTTTSRNLSICGFIRVGSQASIQFQFSDGDDSLPKPITHITQADHDVG